MRFTMLAVLALLSSLAGAQSWDVYPDTWGAVDAIGRSLPDHGAVGAPRSDRFVGMFYFLWLGEHTRTGPWDMTKILAANPSDPQWGPLHHFHHWAEPERGYYVSDDTYVIWKHVQELADAGVDVLIFDTTNNAPYIDNYNRLLNVMAAMREEGNHTPQIAFFAAAGAAQAVYDDLYAPGNHSDLWFRWEGKPLLMPTSATANQLSATLRNFFTVRKTWGLQRIDENDEWSFLQHYPQDVGHSSKNPSVNEFMSVSIAQQETYMTAPTAHGRSYHNGSEPPISQRDDSGKNFAEQWERALSFDPRFIFVTGWNEWVAQRFEDNQGNTRFVDAASKEFSRDIEPMVDGYTDTYYYQLMSFVRRHKGVRPLETATAPGAIAVDGSFEDWAGVVPEYRDTRGDTVHRNHEAWDASKRYTNTTGRNDIIAAKTAVGPDFVYFHVRCAEDITAHTDPNWMLLFIDSDNDHDTGWEGYDLVLNRDVVDASTTTLQRTESGWNWLDVGEVTYRSTGAEMELAIPREWFGNSLEYRFKWADNIQRDDRIIEFSLNGDSAPNRRAFYRVQAEESVPPLVAYHSADTNQDERIDTPELLSVVELYAADGYHCTQDGYELGEGSATCRPHDSDFAPQDWRVSLPELLRLIQFVNAEGYHDCGNMGITTEDHFCAGPRIEEKS